MIRLIRWCLGLWWQGVVDMGRCMLAEPFGEEEILPLAVPDRSARPVRRRPGPPYGDGRREAASYGRRPAGPAPGHPEKPAGHIPPSPVERLLWAQLREPER